MRIEFQTNEWFTAWSWHLTSYQANSSELLSNKISKDNQMKRKKTKQYRNHLRYSLKKAGRGVEQKCCSISFVRISSRVVILNDDIHCFYWKCQFNFCFNSTSTLRKIFIFYASEWHCIMDDLQVMMLCFRYIPFVQHSCCAFDWHCWLSSITKEFETRKKNWMHNAPAKTFDIVVTSSGCVYIDF